MRNSLAIAGDGLVEQALVEQYVAYVEMGQDVGGVELDGRLVVVHGRHYVAHELVDHTSVAVESGCLLDLKYKKTNTLILSAAVINVRPSY